MKRLQPLMKTLASAVLLTALFGVPFSAGAATFTGKMNGHDCAERGTSCPIDNLDPHLALEADFVLQEASGEYYFLVNVPRDVKVRHTLATVEASGDVNRKYNAITVNQLKVNGKVIWSQELADQERQHHLYPGALTNK